MLTSKEESKELIKSPMPFWRRKLSMEDFEKACLIILLHLFSFLALFHFNWNALWVALSFHVITGLGITISYHRNLSHRSFVLPKWLEYLFAYCGVHALQGDPIDWVSTHRFHHQFVDTEKDPHSPIEGFWFSHITWLLNSHALTKKVCPKFFIDGEDREKNIFTIVVKHGRPDNVGDLEKQFFYRFIHKTYLLHLIALAILLYVVGGTPFVLWGMCVRILVMNHVTFMVNSVCHIWGKQEWDTGDLSKNNWLVGILAFGEGWHNNHHAFEYSARHGLEWWQIDITWYIIMFLEAIGMATNVKLPSQSHKDRLTLHKPPKN